MAHDRIPPFGPADDSPERRLADVIDFLPDPLLVVNRRGVITTWNRALEVLTGLPASRMIGKSGHEYAVPFYGDRRPLLIDLVLLPPGELERQHPDVQRQGEILLARQGRHALLWDYTNAYFTWPLMAAGGAYAFRRREDGSYDVRDTGVAHEGAQRGAAPSTRKPASPPGDAPARPSGACARARARPAGARPGRGWPARQARGHGAARRAAGRAAAHADGRRA